MACLFGGSGAVTVGGAEVLGIKNWSVDDNIDALDATTFVEDGIAAFCPGKSQWSGSFDGDKPGAPIAKGAEIALVLKESETAGQVWTGQAIVTGRSAATGHDALVTYSYTFQGTGALTAPTA